MRLADQNQTAKYMGFRPSGGERVNRTFIHGFESPEFILMRSLSPFLLVSLMLAMSMAPMAVNSMMDEPAPDLSATPKALIDFEVTAIEVGASWNLAEQWTQPDGSIEEYVIRDELTQVNVTFTQVGTSSQPAYAEGWMQVWHPIGFLIEEHYVNMTLSGLQSTTESFYYTPGAAHSAVDDDGYLYGGIIVRGTIDGGLADDNEDNNELDREIPVAVWNDPMENGFCGDVDGDQIIDCPNLLNANEPTWAGIGYDADGTLSSDPDYYGHWRMDNASSSVEDRHWRVSRPGADYASNRHDRLWWGWFTPFDTCEDPGHGLNFGTLDPSISGVYGNNFCKIRIRSFDFISMQLVTHAWGEMAAGDDMRIEADAGGGSLEYYDYSAQNISKNHADWTQLVWNMTDIHPNADYTMAFLFDSNSSFANQGIHLDSFLLFGFEKVAEYVLDVDCDDPLPNAYMVVPDDSRPPSLHCQIKNKGYVDITLRLYTEISNMTWMNGFPLRIDSNNMFDHDNYVVTEVIHALETMDTWFNLSIPSGASVEELNWFVGINDGTTNLSKVDIDLPVSVIAAYSASLIQMTLANPAAVLYPGANGSVPMTLRNTGNQVATWNLGATFGDNRWTAENLAWYDSNGTLVTSLEMGITDEFELTALVTAPDEITPGTYSITLLANGRAPANFVADWTIFIEVPVHHDLVLIPEVTEIMAPADGFLRLVEIMMVNNGNSEEAFDLSVLSDWKLGLSLNAEQSLGIDPFGGDSTVMLLLPMPYGTANETYEIFVLAGSQDGSGYQSSVRLLLTVPVTNLVEVEDLDMLQEVFRGGDDARTVNWEITNNGNVNDAFTIGFETSHPDVWVQADGLTNGRTPYIAPGSSLNLTVRYAFGDNAFGDRDITLIATSVEAAEDDLVVTGSGTAEFQVGNQGWIGLFPTNSPMTITESGDDYALVFTVTNNHPTDDQLLRADIDRNSDIFFNIFDARVHQDDRDFVLPSQESRSITVFLTVSEENLNNLAENEMSFDITLEVDGDVDKASSNASIVMIKPVPVDDGPDVEEYAWLTGNILFVLIGLGVIVAVLVVSFRVYKTATAPLEEISTLDTYEMTVDGSGWEGPEDGIPDAPMLPADDEVANSMYGGAQEIFEQPPEMPPPPSEPEPEPEGPELPSGVPPIPDDGLPEGWSVEQWIHYGQRWLDQQNRE